MKDKIDTDRLITICGVGRSGTSLLQSMLNAHPDICFPPETHFFREYVSQKKKRERLESQGIENFVDILSHDKYFKRLGFDERNLLSPYLAKNKPFKLLSVYRCLLSEYAKTSSAHRVGDKDPRIIDYLPHLKKTFPQAIIIHLIRDPRDVLVSRMKAEWSRNKPYWMHILLYQTQMLLGRKLGKVLFSERYFEVKYEDLLKEPELILSKVCTHIGVEYNKSMLDFNTSASKLVASNEMQWKKETLGPLLNKNINKWHKELTPWQISLTEKVCSTAFKELGYECAKAKPQLALTKQLLLILAPFISRTFTYLYKLRTL